MKQDGIVSKNTKSRKVKAGALPILALAVVVGVLSGCDPAVDDDASATPSASASVASEVAPEVAPAEETEVTAPEAPVEPAAPAPEEAGDLNTSQKNAIRSAETYISLMPFSPSSLAEQLQFEGYSAEEASYAVDTLDVNWDEQAVKSAEAYLLVSAFSRDGLIAQLEFGGFSAEQAAAAATSVGL